MANDAALALVEDAAVWHINADESFAFEYSRRNYNAHDFFGAGDDALYGYGNPFRASDHDPVKVGFNANGIPGGQEPGAESSWVSLLTRVGEAIRGVVTQALGALSNLLRIENRFQ